MNEQNKYILINYFVFIWAALAVYFAFTDLEISISVVKQDSWWANFLQDFGEIPGLLVLFCSAHIYLARYSSRVRLFKIFFSIIIFLSATFISGYLIIVIHNGITGNSSVLREYKIVIILVLLLLNFLFHIQIRKSEISNSMLLFSKATVLLGIYGYLFIIQPLKLLWGRVRFKDLDALYSEFTSWLIPNGINGNQSFPSGHAAMAWMILPLIILAVKKSRVIKSSLLIVIMLWALAVGFSRVEIGAHFASDVLFGAFIIIMVFLYLYQKLITKDFTPDPETVS